MQKFIICFYIKCYNTEYSVPLKHPPDFKNVTFKQFDTLYLLELWNVDKWLMSTMWYWRNIVVYILHKLDYSCLTDEMVLTYILWAELTVIYSIVYFKCTFFNDSFG